MMAPYEKLNLLRQEFDLGRNPDPNTPQINKIDFTNEKEIINAFDPAKLENLTRRQRSFLVQHLVQQPQVLEEDKDKFARGSLASVLAASMHSRKESIGSLGASTHLGGSLHIAGFGEAHNFRYDSESDRFPRINVTNSLTQSHIVKEDYI